MTSSLGAGRPSTACQTCKHSKVRCSGEVPRCRRCTRLDAACEYPQNHRRVSLSRHHSAARRPSSPRDKQRQSHSQAHVSSPRSGGLNLLQSPDYLGLPDSVVSKLIDAYFANNYNARLLLHPVRLQDDRVKGVVRPHTLLAICAMGAIFYKDEKCSRPYKDFAPVWAERAGKLVLNEVERPHEDNIVTFAILALFWYMQGSWRRSFIHKGNAMQTAHVLNLVGDKSHAKSPLDCELSRRRFWACFLTDCHTSDSLFVISPAAKLANTLLPWREDDFERGVAQGAQATFGSDRTNGGIYSEMIRALSLWSSVSMLIKTPVPDPSERISSIHKLDAEIRKWWDRLPGELRMSPDNFPSLSRLDLPKVLLINTAYHQCLCALHASIVPLFSWGQDMPEHPLAKQLSAQVAYENARAISRLLELVIGKTTGTSDFSSFIGYAAYCSYGIQIPFNWCLDSVIRESARHYTEVNLQIIRDIGRYWRSVAILDTYALHLANLHSNKQLGLESEPKGLSPSQLSGLRITAARARSSILSINGILWNEDGYVAQGDEATDLGVNSDEAGSSEALARDLSTAPRHIGSSDSQSLSSVDRVTSTTSMYASTTSATLPEPFDFSGHQAPILFQPLLYMLNFPDPPLGSDFEIPFLEEDFTGNTW